MGYRSGLAVGLVAVAIGLMMFGSSSAIAAEPHIGVTGNGAQPFATASGPSCTGTTFMTYGSTYTNESVWGCTMKATDVYGKNLPRHGWTDTIFEVLCSPACDAKITISDAGFVGDYYSLWATDDSTFATDWGMIGETPQVATSSELVASAYNSHWTGAGTKYSSKSFIVYVPQGIFEYFAINDVLMTKMTQKLDSPCGVSATTLLSTGCSVSGIYASSAWSPAGFDVSINGAP